MNSLMIEGLRQQIIMCDQSLISTLIALTSLEQTLYNLEATDLYQGKKAIDHYKSAIRRTINTLDRLTKARQRARGLLVSWQQEELDYDVI